MINNHTAKLRIHGNFNYELIPCDVFHKHVVSVTCEKKTRLTWHINLKVRKHRLLEGDC